jgi:hypothetical protein
MPSGAGFKQLTAKLPEMQEAMRTAGAGFPLDLLKVLKYCAVGSTIHPISNCEDVTDWDIESSGVFNAVNETSKIRVGSNALELVDIGSVKGNFVTLDDLHRPQGEDWTEFNWLCMWLHDDTGARLAGELTVQIRNNGTWSDELNVPICSAADMWQLKCIDITGIAKNKVDGFRFVNQRGSGASEKVYVDEIFVTDLITGVGSGSVATGPVFGPCTILPVETGATIVPGDPVEWGVFGVNTGTANDERIIGIACQDVPMTSVIASDTALKQVIVAIAGAVVFMRNDATGPTVGEPVLFGSDVVTEAAGSGTSNAERGFAISLEDAAGGATLVSGDTAYLILKSGSED